MLTLSTEAQLRACFRDIDRDEVELGAELTLPLVVDGAVGWIVGPRAFLVFGDGAGALRGLVLHASAGGRDDILGMCHSCHAVRGRGIVKLMTVRVDERTVVGIYMCSDLRCVLGADAAALAPIRALVARRVF